MRMDIKPFVDALRRDLQNAAEAGGTDVRAAAERLVLALEPALRLNLLEAFSQAAAEITHELAGTSVEVRLKGRDPSFVVTGSATQAPPAPIEVTGDPEKAADKDGGLQFDGEEVVARITLRLPESLKIRAEELAAGRGQSLNTWLVNAARAAATLKLDVSATPFGPGAPGRNRSSNKRIQGWVR
jgi:hypothetical protein